MPRRFFRLSSCLSLLWLLVNFCQRAVAQPQMNLPHLVTGRLGMPAVVIGDYICVVGGSSLGGYRSDIECIDTTQKSLPVTVWQTHLLPRMFHTAEADGPYIYVLGGMTTDKNGALRYPSEVERLDTRDNSIVLMAPMPTPLRVAASVILNQKLYVAGGSLENGEWTNTLLIYDIATNTWKTGSPMLEKKECELLPWQGGLLAVGGFDGEKAVTGVQSYDIATDTWKALPPLPAPTSAHHGAVVQDAQGHERVVLFGDYADMSRVQIGDPLQGDWHAPNDVDFSARRHAAVVVIGSQIYVIGGSVASLGSCLDGIQVFDAQKLLAP